MSLPIHAVTASTSNLAIDKAMRLYGSDATVLSTIEEGETVTLVVCEVDTVGIDKETISAAVEKAKGDSEKVVRSGFDVSLDDSVSQVMDLLSAIGQPKPVESIKKVNSEKLIEGLITMGFDYIYSKELVGKVLKTKPDADIHDLLKLIDKMLPVEDEDIIAKGGWVAMMGTPGVGKTTTISKIAALYCSYYDKSDVALVTIDTFRVGAVTQLEEFAGLLGIDFHVCSSPEQLLSQTKELSEKRLVLLDTAGKSQKDTLLHNQLKEYLDGDIKNLLVMSAASQLDVLENTISEFECFGINGLVLTKSDEAVKLGSALTAILKKGIPVSYVTTGQQVPQDILRVESGTLMNMACELSGVSLLK